MANPIATSSIAAQAFILAELAPISSFADDTAQAQAAAQFYPSALGICLSFYDWSFARRFMRLQEIDLPIGMEADANLPYLYALPSGFIQLRAVTPDTVKFRRDEQFIRADQAGGLMVRVTIRIDKENQLPDAFQTAVAAQLAYLFSPRWVKSRTKRVELRDKIAEYLNLAKQADRLSASQARPDGRARMGDWASEAQA